MPPIEIVQGGRYAGDFVAEGFVQGEEVLDWGGIGVGLGLVVLLVVLLQLLEGGGGGKVGEFLG